MKKLILIPLLALLSACVSYYYPVEGSDGVYYRDQRPARTDYSASYASTRYYPWWSVDYFYLGGAYGHSHSRYSLGFSYGHSYDRYYGWYDPFAWYYDPWGWSISYPLSFTYWYTPFYSRYHDRYAWNNYYWRDRFDRHHRSRHGDHDRWRRGERERHGDRYADRGRYDGSSTLQRNTPRLRDQTAMPGPDRQRDTLRRRYEDGRIPAAARGKYPKPGGQGDDSVLRQLSVAPGASSGERGMEIRNREERKAQPTRIQPARPIARGGPVPGVVVERPAARVPAYTSRATGEGNALVRSRAERKPEAIRIQPAPDRSRPAQTLSPVIQYEPPRVERGASLPSNASTYRSTPSARPLPAQRANPGALVVRPLTPSRNDRIMVTPPQPGALDRGAVQSSAPPAVQRPAPASRPAFRPQPSRPAPESREPADSGQPAEQPARPGTRRRR
jgi:hypothetical protein